MKRLFILAALLAVLAGAGFGAYALVERIRYDRYLNRRFKTYPPDEAKVSALIEKFEAIWRNSTIRFPSDLRNGRFGDWVENDGTWGEFAGYEVNRARILRIPLEDGVTVFDSDLEVEYAEFGSEFSVFKATFLGDELYFLAEVRYSDGCSVFTTIWDSADTIVRSPMSPEEDELQQPTGDNP